VCVCVCVCVCALVCERVCVYMCAGTGKSTMCEMLSELTNFTHVNVGEIVSIAVPSSVGHLLVALAL